MLYKYKTYKYINICIYINIKFIFSINRGGYLKIKWLDLINILMQKKRRLLLRVKEFSKEFSINSNNRMSLSKKRYKMIVKLNRRKISNKNNNSKL